MLKIQPATLSRTWKPRFEEKGWGAFYDDGVDVAELHAGMIAFEREKAKEALNVANGGDDPAKISAWQRVEDQALDLQAKRGLQVYVPDFADEIRRMGMVYRQATERVPRTLAPILITWIATQLATEMQEHPEVAKAIGLLNQGDVQTFLEDRLNETTGDMGKALDLAWRNAIRRAQLKAS